MHASDRVRDTRNRSLLCKLSGRPREKPCLSEGTDLRCESEPSIMAWRRRVKARHSSGGEYTATQLSEQRSRGTDNSDNW